MYLLGLLNLVFTYNNTKLISGRSQYRINPWHWLDIYFINICISLELKSTGCITFYIPDDLLN